MDYKKRKEELLRQYNQIDSQINQLLATREQIRGKLIFIEEIEKEKPEKKEGKKK